jgi:hypothetical protein
MSPEVSLMLELWERFKGYVPAKERPAFAEEVLTLFEDHVDVSDVEVYKNEFDTHMKAAIVSHFDEEIEEDDDEDWE